MSGIELARVGAAFEGWMALVAPPVLSARWPGPPKRLDQVDTQECLGRMGALRNELATIRSQLRGGSIPDRTFAALEAAIDRSAHLITGDEAFFAPV